MTKISYAGYRFPPEIIQRAVWLYYRFTLSFRDVEDLLVERGIIVSYETIRRWAIHFGPKIAADLRAFVPGRLVTDDLRSYAAAARDLGLTRRHNRGRWRNNRAENSHSADAATRTQDARVQERRIGAKISLFARRHSEYLLRPTPSHLGTNAPGLQGVGDDHVAPSRCCGVMSEAAGICHALDSTT